MLKYFSVLAVVAYSLAPQASSAPQGGYGLTQPAAPALPAGQSVAAPSVVAEPNVAAAANPATAAALPDAASMATAAGLPGYNPLAVPEVPAGQALPYQPPQQPGYGVPMGGQVGNPGPSAAFFPQPAQGLGLGANYLPQGMGASPLPSGGAPYAPPSGAPYAPPSGTPYAPPSGTPYAPPSGTPYVPPTGQQYGPPSGGLPGTPEKDPARTLAYRIVGS